MNGEVVYKTARNSNNQLKLALKPLKDIHNLFCGLRNRFQIISECDFTANDCNAAKFQVKYGYKYAEQMYHQTLLHCWILN